MDQGRASMAGINTNVYKPHSCRSASTSKVRDNGVSIRDILKRGYWKSQNTFTIQNSIPKILQIKKIVGKTWNTPSFSLKNRESTNSIYLFIFIYTG